MNEGEAKHASDLAQRLHIKVESATIAGVHIFYVKPGLVPDLNKARLMMHVHGGAYVAFGGRRRRTEAILLAHSAGIETVSVDYRMPPDAPFPAAVDDSVAVWRELINGLNPFAETNRNEHTRRSIISSFLEFCHALKSLRLAKRSRALVETNPARNSRSETHQDDGSGSRLRAASFLAVHRIDRSPHA